MKDEVTVALMVIDVHEEPPAVLLRHDTIGLRGVKRVITQKVPVPGAALFARVASFAQTGIAAKAVIVTKWREDNIQKYLRDFIPSTESRELSNGAVNNGASTSRYSTPT